MATNLPVDALDFEGIKSNLKDYLKNTNKFNDFNFEASGISTLINLLAYNTHYIGYYVKMLMNESFIDSAVLRSTLLSKAKLTGYVPKSAKAAKATLTLDAYLTEFEYNNLNGAPLILNALSKFSSTNPEGDLKIFTNLESYQFDFIKQEGTTYHFQASNVIITEGQYVSDDYMADSLNRYIISNKAIDIDTLRMYGNYASMDYIAVEITKVGNLFEVGADSTVFYLSTNENSQYEIFFGNDIFGKSLNTGDNFSIKYIATSGSAGNGCNTFRFEGIRSINYPNDFSNIFTKSVSTQEQSGGGNEQESIEELKFSIPKANTRQNRLVSADDFKSFLLSEYRNIDSISVYGGEDVYKKEFGRVYITIKPKNSPVLSYYAKKEILSKVKPLMITGLDLIFNDPNYLNINLSVFVKLRSDNTLSSLEAKNLISAIIDDYNKNYLNRFENSYSDIEILSRIKKQIQSVFTLYTRKVVSKQINILFGSSNEIVIDFGKSNQISPDSFYSDTIYYNEQECYLKEVGGNIFIFNASGTKLLNYPIGSVDHVNSIVKLTPDVSFRSNKKFSTSYLYSFYITPVSQDVFSYNDTLVNISALDVTIQ